ncbi:hypothetical protein GCM10023231_14750 [Olivibacter ginsenosidimutans]|uniref:Peptidase M56 domain-containing protein n=1 Tax=Olivibacter ginsenosidimutans TaxID=1176537 RepID=A0ABP9AZW5_9SPHI
MPELIIYLLKANIVLTLFYLGYYFFLRKLTFYMLNRYYLLAGTLIALMYPLLDISSFLQRQEYLKSTAVLMVNWQELTSEVSPKIDGWDVSVGLFWLTVSFFAVRFFIRLFTLWRIHKQSEPSRYTTYDYRKVLLKINPFSFWKTIYVNPSLHKDADLDDIFKHELVHTQELHTLDVLLVELLTIGFWFNPTTWFMRQAIKENLEFITDRKVLASGVDRKSYQYSLVHIMTSDKHMIIGNHFSMQTLKKRIRMMNKRQSAKINLGKYVLVLPLIIVLALIFTISKAYEETQDISSNLVSKQLSATENNLKDSTKNTIGNSKPLKIAENPKQDTTKSRSVGITKIKVRKDSVDKKEGARIPGIKLGDPLYILDGKPISTLNAVNPNNIERIEVLKDTSAWAVYGPRYGTRAKNGVVLITTKVKHGETKKNADSVTNIHAENEVDIKSEIPKGTKFFVNGVSIKRDDFEQLDPNTIDSMNVVKDAATGKGSIYIVTKKKAK